MAFPDSTTLAPARAGRFKNRPAAIGANNLPRAGWLAGSYDSVNKTGVVPDVPKEVFSAEQVGDETGWGFALHRGAIEYFKNGQGTSLWITPQADAVGATQATKTLTVTVTTAVAGTIYLYIANELVTVGVVAGATDEEIAAAIVTELGLAKWKHLPVTAANTLGVVTFTSKTFGTYGNFITVAVNIKGQSLPGGVTVAIADGVSGATDPDIDDALAGLGVDDDANSISATDAAYSYETDETLAEKVSVYVGKGDESTGTWAPTVERPMRFIAFDTTAGTAGLTAMKAITDVQLENRAIAYAGAPDCYRHPFDLACEALGWCASINQANAHRSYVGLNLTGDCGTARWTKNGTTRDNAIKDGVSTTRVINGVLKMDGMVTMYRPASIPVNNNAYRSFRNISIAQNMLNSHREFWANEASFTIVKDIRLVDPAEKPYVKDIAAVEDLNALMVTAWQGKAWIFDAQYSIENQEVTLREANNGFDIKLPVIYSAEGVVSDTEVEADISLAVFTGQ
jgi:phage tail sheath gpL-like